MNYIFYCPVCGKFSKETSLSSGETVICNVCNNAKAFVANEDEFYKIGQKKTALESDEKEKKCIVSTGDIREEYEIIGPVFSSINDDNTQGNSLFIQYREEYAKEQYLSENLIDDNLKQLVYVLKHSPLLNHSEYSQQVILFMQHIAMQMLKENAISLGADAIVFMHSDVSWEPYTFGLASGDIITAHCYINMYGTAVKIKRDL